MWTGIDTPAALLRASVMLLVALAWGCEATVDGLPGQGRDAGGVADTGSPRDADAAGPPGDAGLAAACGNGTCGAGENCSSCATDCGECDPACGDGMCNGSEDCAVCLGDCGVCGGTCGDGLCNGAAGDTCLACAADCNTRDVACGNGECQPDETSTSCWVDCGPAVWPLEWAGVEEAILAAVNVHRAAGTDCPGSAKQPAAPLAMNAALRTAARLHSWDLSRTGYFDHTSCNGRSPGERAAAQGESLTAETIGRGYPSAEAMVAGWMSSPGHCGALMSQTSTQVGFGVAQVGARVYTGNFR